MDAGGRDSAGQRCEPWFSFPSGLSMGRQGVTWDGTQLIVVIDGGGPDELWTLADVTQPGNAVNVKVGSFPSGLGVPPRWVSPGTVPN